MPPLSSAEWAVSNVLSGHLPIGPAFKSLSDVEQTRLGLLVMGEAIMSNRRDLFEWAKWKVKGTARLCDVGTIPFSWQNTAVIHPDMTFFEFALRQNRPAMVGHFLKGLPMREIPDWVWVQAGKLSSPEILRKIIQHGYVFTPVPMHHLQRSQTGISTVVQDATRTELIQHECVLSAVIQCQMGFVKYLDNAGLNWNEVDHLGNHCLAHLAPCIERTTLGAQRDFTLQLIDWLADARVDLHQRNHQGQSFLDIWEQRPSSSAQAWISSRWKNTLPVPCEESSHKRL